ncbi:hypothetical protein P3T20_004076 [Paraburkholderia sp. GAS206C]|uniref:hypothetical protein n=1 Tax=unclassified Paraburkholderia TaxID=2615204 RepID=UPI003D24732E
MSELAAINAQGCLVHCASLRLRRGELDSRLEFLDTETDEAKRQEAGEDRQVELTERAIAVRDALREDPVTAQLTDWLRLSEQTIKGTAGLCRLLWFEQRSLSSAPEARRGTVSGTPRNDQGTIHRMLAEASVTEFDSRLERLDQAVKVNQVKLTVNDTQAYFWCGRGQAAELRRAYVERQTSE